YRFGMQIHPGDEGFNGKLVRLGDADLRARCLDGMFRLRSKGVLELEMEAIWRALGPTLQKARRWRCF
ncbi:MAG: hypothetical protein ABL921_30925, partial [Pirellula sp.]